MTMRQSETMGVFAILLVMAGCTGVGVTSKATSGRAAPETAISDWRTAIQVLKR